MEFWALTWCVVWYILSLVFLFFYCRDVGLKNVIEVTWEDWENEGWVLPTMIILAPIVFPIVLIIAVGCIVKNKIKKV